MWKDANGAIVPIIGVNFGSPGLVFFADANGYIWANQFRDGPGVALHNFTTSIYYATSDCSGTAYVPANPPRVTFRLNGESVIHAAAENVAPVTITVAATGPVPPGSACQSVGGVTFPIQAVPYASTLPATPLVVPTSLPGVQPVHPEFVP